MVNKIYAHTLVKNEERFLWYAVRSVIDHVDKVLLWDTGSTDKTVLIAKELKKRYPNKIIFREVKQSSTEDFTRVRQQMLDETDADWFLVVDGDEIWWDRSIKKVVNKINKKGNEIESIVVPVVNLVGDIYHKQEEAAGKYKLAGRKGHLNLRAVNRNIPGLHAEKPHGQFGWADGEGNMIEKRGKDKVIFIDASHLHATHLRRSSKRKKDIEVIKRKKKLKFEIGKALARDYYYPEAFFRKRPDVVVSPWEKMNRSFFLRGVFETPLRKLKRRLFKSKVGY